MSKNQVIDAQDLYDNRAVKYDDSWHPRFARHMVEVAKVRPGEKILDLACGTGLVSFEASKRTGPSGNVVGVDVSSGMLRQAALKQESHEPSNVEFHQHSISDLGSLAAIKEERFDLITCCSALVLLEQPQQALAQWITYLNPGGRIVVDVTHPRNHLPGIIFEKVGRTLDRPLPWYRLAFQKPSDLSSIMTAADFVDVQVLFISQQAIDGTERLEDYTVSFDAPRILCERSVGDANRIFDEQIDGNALSSLASPREIRARARELFMEEWKKSADEHGKVEEVDGVFVGIGWKM